MTERTDPVRGIVPHGEQDVVIIGPPSCLAGPITLRNTAEQRLRVRRGRVNRIGDIITAESGLACAIGSARAEAGATVTADIEIELPPWTPAGEYRAEIEINGVPIEARVIVTEVVDLEMSPSQFVIENRPRVAVTRRVAARNRGNVALTIGEIGPVVLDDELLECRTLRAALKELTDPEPSIESVLGAIARSASATLDQGGILRVHNATATQTIEPGETKVLDLEVRVPDHLDRHTRDSGTARIYTSNLAFLVVPAGADLALQHEPGELAAE